MTNLTKQRQDSLHVFTVRVLELHQLTERTTMGTLGFDDRTIKFSVVESGAEFNPARLSMKRQGCSPGSGRIRFGRRAESHYRERTFPITSIFVTLEQAELFEVSYAAHNRFNYINIPQPLSHSSSRPITDKIMIRDDTNTGKVERQTWRIFSTVVSHARLAVRGGCGIKSGQ
ncbi:hypothetical protein RhiJN_21418 [Ceratobasidium sp. AG-Ba]|nr:hypothetical protein RhiJN_21418 [Ceratobasidium sp. AG-Ba]